MQKSKGKIKHFVKETISTASMLAGSGMLGLVVGLTIVDTPSVTNIVQYPSRFSGINTSLFSKSKLGMPLVLKVKDGVIDLNIMHCFTESQLDDIKRGIMELDDIAKGFSYTTTESSSEKQNAINIYVDNSLGSEEIAQAQFRTYNLGTNIVYPINIVFNKDYVNKSYIDLTSAIKHELLHTLGFRDLYENKDRNHIMYFESLGNGLNSEEREALNQVYSTKWTGVSVKKPTDIEYIFEEETAQTETMEDELVQN